MDNLEQTWSSVRLPDDGAEVLVDFSACTFIETAGLIDTLSRLSAVVSKGLDPRLSMPRSLDVRNIMRRWAFPEAVSATLRRPFSQIVVESDKRYFGETSGQRVNVAERSVLPDLYMPIRVFNLSGQASDAGFALSETERWQAVYVRSVLERTLGRGAGGIGPRVIHEGVLNAIRHPFASVVGTCSQLPRAGTNRHLTMLIWDNGRGIPDTLQDALQAKGKLAPIDVPGVHKTFEVVRHADQKISTHRLYSGDPLVVDMPREDIFVGALFPGISSAHEPLVHPEIGPDEHYNTAGMGLYVLLRTLVDQYRGTLSVRAPGLFMNLKASTEPDVDYRAKIRLFSSDPFVGNTLVMRIPLGSSATES